MDQGNIVVTFSFLKYMEGDLTWGSQHTIPCTNDVLYNCALETCIIWLTSLTPISSIKYICIFLNVYHGDRIGSGGARDVNSESFTWFRRTVKEKVVELELVR